MATGQISDPTGTNGGNPEPDRLVWDVPATAAVAIGDLVAITMTNPGGLMQCAPALVATHTAGAKVGVALNAAAIGFMVRCVVFGPAIVKTPAAGPAVGNAMTIGAVTAGVSAFVVADATTVAGQVKGTFLTAEIGTSDTSWVFVNAA